VIIGYLVLTFAILVVGGQNAAFNAPNPVALLVSTVQTVLGPLAGSITIIGIMLFYVVVGIFENCISARLLMVAGIDQRLPQSMGRLNRFRIPANAIIFQTIIATLYTAVIFFLVPAFTFLGNADTLTVEAYTITAASLLLVWAFSFMFPFLDLGMLYSRYRKDTASREAFLKQLICPLPVLMICIVVGPIVCAATIIVTLISSWIPQLISSNQWWYIVGVVTMILLVFSIIGSMLASSQAAWEDLNG
jgi:hypothetical protein